jgi:integrase
MGHSPIEISQLTGHDVEVLYSHYTGHVNSKPRLPEIIPEQETDL